MDLLHLLHVLLVNLLFLFRLAPRDCEFDFVFEVFKIEIVKTSDFFTYAAHHKRIESCSFRVLKER